MAGQRKGRLREGWANTDPSCERSPRQSQLEIHMEAVYTCISIARTLSTVSHCPIVKTVLQKHVMPARPVLYLNNACFNQTSGRRFCFLQVFAESL